MTLADVAGQPRALEALRAALQGDSVHHAYLFDGQEGVGKELAALGFAQAQLCLDKPGAGCGTCAICGRVARRNHPDVTFVMPEEEQVARGQAGRSDFAGTPSRDIKVEQIRGLQERLSLRALEGKRKIAIVLSAERLNVQAQNAFLKTLEEPPAATTIILVSSASEKLLPTIRSRCAKIPFGPLPVAMLAERIKKARKVDDATAQLAAVMAGGSLSRALALDVDGLEQRTELVEAFEKLRPEDAQGLLRFAESFGGSREDAEDALRVLAVWLRDVAVAKVGGALVNRDLEPLAREAGERVSDASLHRRHALIAQALEAISTKNGAPRLQLERMLIEMGGP